MSRKGGAISTNDVREVRSLPNPPQMVKDTVSAIFVVLGETRKNAEIWKFAVKEMAKPGFIERLSKFDPASVTPEAAKYAHDHVLRDNSVEHIMKVSLTASSLYRWLENTVQASGQETRKDSQQ